MSDENVTAGGVGQTVAPVESADSETGSPPGPPSLSEAIKSVEQMAEYIEWAQRGDVSRIYVWADAPALRVVIGAARKLV